MTDKHQTKVKLARRLRSPEELVGRVPIFQTEKWEERKKAIKNRVIRKETKAKKKIKK